MSSEPSGVDPVIQRIEAISPFLLEDKLRNLERAEETLGGLLVEIVLHASQTSRYVVDSFIEYASSLGVETRSDKAIFASGLYFVPTEATEAQLSELGKFSFMRAARPLSKMRSTPQVERSSPLSSEYTSTLPPKEPVDDSIRVAIFDGGFPSSSPLAPWVRSFTTKDLGAAVPELEDHGHDVTSALLFGTLEPGVSPRSPLCEVDHYRVLDDASGTDPYELYDVLRRIKDVLDQNEYNFVNLSLGPSVSIEDDDVHPWTAVLDGHLADGKTLMSVAVGNNGEHSDSLSRRIQVPADCINGFALGAADSSRAGWAKAAYSATGPGRSPGYVKPDVLDFGGTLTEPFLVYQSNTPGQLAWTQGTSFASPSALGRALSMRAHFGDRLTPLGIRALLVQSADHREQERREVGWGRLPSNLDEIVSCGDGQVRVLYQGELHPGQYLRARLPLPSEELLGKVGITATFCFATETDPEDPGSYSRAGLDITFRPHSGNFKDESAVDPKTDSFFKRGDWDTERALRTDAQKWETTLRASRSKLGRSLREPVFDIHYNARSNGGMAQGPKAIPYSLVVDVESKRTADLYDRVANTYAGRLEALQPIVAIPASARARIS
ncbi:S8 family peptidase [Nesterenkonia sp. Hz 6-5]|nr:S8 family peptidase [Nesterenkonia haasae]